MGSVFRKQSPPILAVARNLSPASNHPRRRSLPQSNLEETMPVTTKRSRKVVPIKGRGGMTGRGGAIDFTAKAALMNLQAVNPDEHIYRVIEIVGTSEQSI